MPIVRVTVFQKQIHQKMPKEDMVKLKEQKSQFLLLPEGYPGFFRSDNLQSQVDQFKSYSDHLLEISELYSGVSLGGSVYRNIEKQSGKLLKSCPMVQNQQLIDFYDKKNVSNQNELVSGTSERIFILSGVRFGICLGEDFEEKEFWEETKTVELIFHLTSEYNSLSYEETLSKYSEKSQSEKKHIVRVCSIERGKAARSLYTTPTGINWKTGKMEEDKEVIKTLSVNLTSSIFN